MLRSRHNGLEFVPYIYETGTGESCALDVIRQVTYTMFNRLRSSVLGSPQRAPDVTKNATPESVSTNGSVPNGDSHEPDYELKLGDFSIDEYRPFKVIVIGAGFSGIAAGIRYVKYAFRTVEFGLKVTQVQAVYSKFTD